MIPDINNTHLDCAVSNDEFKKVLMYSNIMPIINGTSTIAMFFIYVQ